MSRQQIITKIGLIFFALLLTACQSTPTYDEWVDLLKNEIQEIDNKFSSLNNSDPPKHSKSRSAAVSTATCSDDPSTYLSGRVTIRKHRVNLRSGSSTTCKILDVAKKTESFDLLGQKNNWYYIALDNGQNAWIYAPLVQRFTDKQATAQSTSTVAEVKSKPPAVPTKKIRIAVIHFKTLNKEAQDISLGELVSEVFTSVLVNSNNFKIIEREQLEKVVSEIEMNQTGFIETTDVVEIGKMLQADAIVTGSVALLADQIQLNARIIEINSAFVISADSKTTKYTLKNINHITSEIVHRFSQKLINVSAS
ncbi:MAG: FlgO family outer membrane protein [Methylococcales bacterium]